MKLVQEWLFAFYSGPQITNVKHENHVFLNLEVGSNFINDIHMWHYQYSYFNGVYSLRSNLEAHTSWYFEPKIWFLWPLQYIN